MNMGHDQAEIRAAVAALGTVQDKMRALTIDPRDGWRHELIALRRRLQTQIGEVSTLLSRPDCEPVVARPLLDGLSRLRAKVALHQASWPAVSIELADPRHRASVEGVRAAHREFTALAERTLHAH